MTKRFIVFYVFFFMSTILWGQVHKGFQWISPDHILYKIDLKTGILSQEDTKNLKTELGKIENWDVIKNELPGDFGVNAFYRGDSTLITIPGTGQIYSLHLPNLNLKRLDQTFFRGYNFNASQFFRNDTLFSIGGEGFWLKHSVITYYNPRAFEWAFYKFQKENKHGSTNKFSGYSKKHDAFFTALIETNEIIEGTPIPFRIYNFKNDVWENKGVLSDSIRHFAKRNYRSIWTGQYLILVYDSSDSKVYIADPFENVLYMHKTTNDLFFILNCELYNQNGKLFSRSLASTGKLDKVYFDSLSVDSLIKNSTVIGNVYEEKHFSNQNIGIAIIAFVFLSIALLVYRRQRSKYEDYTLTEIELQVVKKLINQPIGIKITSNELNNLLDINNKTYDNQRQIRYRIIGSINQKLRGDLDSKDLIFRSSNVEDKRMMDYYINPDIKQKDLEKLIKSFQL